MLVLTRKREESIRIGNDIVIKVTQIHGGKVKLGIEAPAHVRILRAELAAFDQTPASVVACDRLTETSEKNETSEPAMEDDCELVYGQEYMLEVEDVMMCVGVR